MIDCVRPARRKNEFESLKCFRERVHGSNSRRRVCPGGCVANQTTGNFVAKPPPAAAPNGTKWDDALEPGRSSRRYLLACGARVHVDFHANRHLNDLRCFPGHQRTPSSRHGCRINMVRPHRKGRKPASTKHLGVGFSRIGIVNITNGLA